MDLADKAGVADKPDTGIPDKPDIPNAADTMAANLPNTPATPVLGVLSGSDRTARPAKPARGPRLSGVHLAPEMSEALMAGAEWFVRGESPWRSIRALAGEFQVHWTTAGDYVKRAERRKVSQQRADRRRTEEAKVREPAWWRPS
jgi:hypothetical protein